MLADYGSTGVTLREHPLELMRPGLPADLQHQRASSSAHPHGRRVRVAGLVIARQRPATAKGVTFMLLEDEHGTINLIVSPPVHDRFRLAVRSEPLVLASGRLERREGTANVIVDSIERLDRPDLPPAKVTHIEPRRVWSATPASSAPSCRRPTASAAAARHLHGPWPAASSWAPRAGPTPASSRSGIRRSSPAKERLPWYAQRFELVELNSSFYAIPDRSTVHGWVEVTPARLHVRREGAPGAVEALGAGRVAAARPTRAARRRPELERPPWRSGSSRRRPPLRDAGKFGAYLLQLTPAFSPRQAPARGARRLVGRPRPARAGRRAAQPQLGRRRAARGDARLVRRPRRRVRRRGRSARRQLPDHAAARRGHEPADRLPARPRPQHEGLSHRAGRWPSASPGSTRTRSSRRSPAARARLAESAGEVHVAFNNNRGDDAPTAAQRFRALLGQEVPEPDDPQLTL